MSAFKSGIFPVTPIEGTGYPDMLDRIVIVFDHKVSD